MRYNLIVLSMEEERPARISYACHFGPILWLFLILPNAYSNELTVKKEDLRKCVHNDYVCVIDQMDCAPTSPGFNLGTTLLSPSLWLLLGLG